MKQTLMMAPAIRGDNDSTKKASSKRGKNSTSGANVTKGVPQSTSHIQIDLIPAALGRRPRSMMTVPLGQLEGGRVTPPKNLNRSFLTSGSTQ